MKTRIFILAFIVVAASSGVYAQITTKKNVTTFNFASSQSSTTITRLDLKKVVKFTFNNFAIRSYKLSFMDAVNKTLVTKTVSGDGNLFVTDPGIINSLPNVPAQGKIYFDDIKYVDGSNQTQTSTAVLILAD